jgi:tetratricopeptide (TPR) repeat protein
MGLRERRESADVVGRRLVGYCRSVSKVGWSEGANEAAKGEALLRAGRLEEAEEAFARGQAFGRALAIALELADGELDAPKRLRHLARAVRHAPQGTDEDGAREVKLRYYRARRALLLGAAGGATQRNELAEVGRAFEALDALDEAARTYRDAGDDEARLRVLLAAGEIDGVEEVLAVVRQRESSARRATELRAIADHLWATGQRDEAARTLVRAAEDGPEAARSPLAPAAATLLERLATSRARVAGTRVRERVAGSDVQGGEDESEIEVTWVFGDRVVVGRAEDATIRIASPLVSRRHLVISRGEDGLCQVENVGASTLLAGAQVAGRLSVNGYTKLALGPVTLELFPRFEDDGEPSRTRAAASSGGATGPRRFHSVRVVVAGTTYRLPLGPLTVGPFEVVPVPLPVGVSHFVASGAGGDRGDGLRLRPTAGAGSPPSVAVPYLDSVTACPEGIDLVRGDRIAQSRGGPPLLHVLA